MKFLIPIVLLLSSVVGCDRDVGPPLEVSATVVFAPLPGTPAAVAYMTIKNNTQTDILLNSISSPQFASVMLHETQITAGIARMVMLKTLLIPAHSSVILSDGGLHIMLMKPVQAVELAQPVSLHINYDNAGLVIVSTTVQSRFGHESAD